MDGKVVQSKIENGVLRIDLFNMIDESINLPSLTPEIEKLVVNFSGVTFINSIGIVKWVNWLKTIKASNPTMKIELSDLTMSLIRALDFIPDVLPESATVSSFYYYFFCGNCNEEIQTRIPNTADLPAPSQKCPKCQEPMDLELSFEIYKTLARHAPTS